MSTVSLHWFSDLARSVTPTFVKNFIIRNQGVDQFVSSIYSANGQLFVVFFPQTEGDLFLHSAWILINWDFPNLYWGCRERHFRRLNCWFSLQDRLCQPCPAALAAGNQPARHKQGWWVGCVLTDCLWLIEWKSPCIFLEKCQGGCVEISTVFINPDIYWGKMTWAGAPV
jgi:hypothetical protein